MVEHCGEEKDGLFEASINYFNWTTATEMLFSLVFSTVFVMSTGELTACDVQEGAVNGGHPQVGGAGVKHHSEGLRRGTQADLPVILGLPKKRQEHVNAC